MRINAQNRLFRILKHIVENQICGASQRCTLCLLLKPDSANRDSFELEDAEWTLYILQYPDVVLTYIKVILFALSIKL